MYNNIQVYEANNQKNLKSVKINTRKDVVILGRKIVEHFLYRNNKLYAIYFSRALRWPTLSAGEHDNGVTKQSFISDIDKEGLRKALQLGDSEIIYRCCERIFLNVGGNLYFDLQQYTYNAACELKEYRVAEFIISSLQSLLKRSPEIIDLKFSCGTPFASDSTKLWIQNKIVNIED